MTKKTGGCDAFCVDLLKLAKLQAFIDKVFQPKLDSYTQYNFFKVFDEPQINTFISFRDIEHWYASQVFSVSESLLQIISYIRTTEWYLLVSFLIKERLSETVRIQYLSDKYGLSSSYFRYLCRQVLGDSVKGQMNDWRLASALINMIRTESNMTDTAYKAGYSSLAHFSSDVKKTLGHSPRDLKKTILS